MSDIQLDYSEITEIFKEKLKIENIVKKISSVFLNQRYASKINYKPYFQRNYVWDDEKATYFIESILLGTEIPPIVLFLTRNNIFEVIDGRQRYETIERFLNDKLTLNAKGLQSLHSLAGKRYSQLPAAVKDGFEDTRIRILQFQVVNEPKLDEKKEDTIKKEIFRRYNSGITPLVKYDIARAEYNNDQLTNDLVKLIDNDDELYEFLRIIMVPKRKMKTSKRDQTNILVTLIRTLITLPMIPINVYAKAGSKNELIHKYYETVISNDNYDKEIEKFKIVIIVLKKVYEKCNYENVVVKDSKLFYEVLYWGISIIIGKGKEVKEQHIIQIVNILKNAQSKDIWNNLRNKEGNDLQNVFNPTGSHYYSAINDRYRLIANILERVFNESFEKYLKMTITEDSSENQSNEIEEINKYKLNKPLPETLTIEDILNDMRKSRFLIRPDYQRSEVKDLQKASYLMESILLRFTIPPLFVYKRVTDNVREVVDGQQRLLTILGFLGRTYLNEKGEYVISEKDKFRLTKLKILKELNGLNILTVGDQYEDSILEFPMDIIEIDGNQNKEFNPIDLFLRLNTKPYPIKDNTFEMWNAYIDRNICVRVREIAEQYQNIVFRSRDNRMKLEELITSLAYIDYQMKKGVDFTQVVNVYKRNNRMCARIMSKNQMTKILGEASKDEPEVFLESVDSVAEFAEKIMCLLSEDKTIRDLLNHSRKGTGYKTDQNYYFLWIILKPLNLDYLQTNKQFVFYKVQKIFYNAQNAFGDSDGQQFIKELSSSMII